MDTKHRHGRLSLVAASILAISSMSPAVAQRAGQSMSIQTGLVVGARAVNLQSAAPSGAAVGGMVGYATTSKSKSSSRRARNAIIGATAGSAIARRSQGSLNGMQYTVQTAPGSKIVVVTDQTQVRVGDCVNVEQAGTGTANVRRVSAALCEMETVDEVIQEEIREDADLCLEAKGRLMEAETDQQLEVAMRRVEFLCND